jgi:hypothetical protein
MGPVYRVNWLRAKARYDRWSEELQLVPKEMEWTIATFRHYEEEWRKRAEKYRDGENNKGCYSYALRKRDMWRTWREKARIGFEEAIGRKMEQCD